MTHFGKIWTHHRPHLDEIVAMYMLQRYGTEEFPGINKAIVEFKGRGGQPIDGVWGDDLLKQGIVCIGVGGGMFDEHPTIQGHGSKKDCSSLLVAKYLGIDDTSLQKILDFSQRCDSTATSHPFDLTALVKAMNAAYPDDPGKVIAWAMDVIYAKHLDQDQFLYTQDHFFENTQVEEIPGPNGTITLMTCKMDNEHASKVARSNGATIVIQQQKFGNVQIHTDVKAELDLRDICRMIRIEEMEAKGLPVPKDWKLLEQKGTIKGAEQWYFPEYGSALFNGSTSYPDTPPTQIALETIQKIVRIGVNPNAFEPSKAKFCKRKECIACAQDPCTWYELGLLRCRTIRYNQKK